MKDMGREYSKEGGTLLSFFLPGKELRMHGNMDEFQNLKDDFCFLSKESVNSYLLVIMAKQAVLAGQGRVVIVGES